MMYFKGEGYRDTSLITCGEYQVFLDEQQDTGKYYQPDHWRGNSFPSGSCIDSYPRVYDRSDAQAFCDWLTTRDREGWHYSLPLVEEWPLEERRRQKELRAETGYWVEDEPFFVWSQGKPSDVLHQQFLIVLPVPAPTAPIRDVDLTRALARAGETAPSRSRALSPARAPSRSRSTSTSSATSTSTSLSPSSATATAPSIAPVPMLSPSTSPSTTTVSATSPVHSPALAPALAR